ncbi:hypothetical protein LP419_05690 [Massilia sp. H-1]|nr:hypothetical protein LP419_05690 [Massilia sp. H-1]
MAADASDALTVSFLTDDTLSVADIRTGLRAMTLARRAVPVLAGSAYRNA